MAWTMEQYRWATELFSWIAGLLILICITFPFVVIFLRCFAPKYASKLDLFFQNLIIRFIETLFSTFPLFGGKSRQKLLFIPNADQQSVESWMDYIYKSNHRNGFCEISQDALSRHLLNKDTANLIDKLNSDGSSKTFDKTLYDMLCCLKDFNKEAKITKFKIYRSSMHWFWDSFGIYHTFIVFQTDGETEEEYWWSLEKNTEYIVMQRSRNQFAVVNRLMRKDRKNVERIPGNNPPIEGQDARTMANLLTTLWAHNITEKYHVVKASCQTFVQFIEKANHKSFVDFVHKRITSFEPTVPYSAHTSNKKFEPIINLLTNFPKWPTLFSIVYLGDPVLLENLLCNNKYNDDINVNLVDNGTSVLQLAILFSKTKMVEILLRNPKLNLQSPHQNEGSDKPWKGMSVFHTAAAFTGDAKIIDLLFQSEKVDTDNDAMGRNALHIAAMESNETIVGHVLKMFLIDPNVFDSSGLTPFHLAAQHTDNTNIIDLLLQAKMTQQRDRGIDGYDNKGKTALHHAVIGSNVTAARHLIKKGANPNQTDRDGTTPLELAAQEAKDMKIVDLFLENESVYRDLHVKGGDKVFISALKNTTRGLSNEIEQRLRSKNITRKLEIPPEGQLDSSSETQSEADPKHEERQSKFTDLIAANCSIL